MNNVWTVLVKEVMDTLRDRRTLIIMVVVPILLMPAMSIMIGKIAKWQVHESMSQKITVAVAGAAASPSLLATLESDDTIEIKKMDQASECELAVRERKAACGLVIADGFDDAIRSGGTGTLSLVQKGSEFQSMTAAQRVQAHLNAYVEEISRFRMRTKGVDPQELHPVKVDGRDVATDKERGGFMLGFILPMLLVMWALAGGMFTAIDVSAGEKERNTLETLLLTPAPKSAIALGKLLAIFAIAFGSILASLISFAASLHFFPLELSAPGAKGGAMGSGISLTPELTFLILSVSALLALAFAALQLAMGIYARTFKEAQNLINPLYLIVVLPVGLVNAAPGFKPGPVWFLFPGFNAAIVFKEGLIGTYDPMHIAVTVGSLVVFAVGSVVAAIYLFTREDVLFKSA